MPLRAVVVLLLLSTSQLAAQADSLQRVRSSELWIPLPGRAVIRDSADWAVLWQRFGRIGRREGELIRPKPPEVRFEDQLLIAVSMGRGTGCDNTARYVHRIREEADSVVVEVGREQSGPRITCMAEINPVDVVSLPRSSAPIAFRPNRDDKPEPGPASWWETPSGSELDSMDPRERGVFMLALALDENTPDSLLVAVAGRLSAVDWTIGDLLLERPGVRRNPDAVFALTHVRSTGEKAKRILLDEHGTSLAGDPSTPGEVLRTLMSEARSGDAYREMAERLLQHPAVRTDQELLLDFTYFAQHYRDLWLQGCDLYLKRWPRTMVLQRNAAGEPITTRSTICR